MKNCRPFQKVSRAILIVLCFGLLTQTTTAQSPWKTGAYPGDTTSNPSAVIWRYGHVGIGLDNPESMLHVSEGDIRLYRPGRLIFGDNVSAFSSDDGVWIQNSKSYGFPTPEPFGLSFYTANTERMKIDSLGFVGIGTDAPEYKLHVNSGTIYANGSGSFFEGLKVNNTSGRSVIQLLGNGTLGPHSAELVMWDNAKSRQWSLIHNDNSAFSIHSYSSTTGYRYPFQVRWGAPTNSFFIASNGNVGVGTSAPQSELAVNGEIQCKEIEVTLSGWPDYVFLKDYKLMPLSGLDSFLQVNTHLPGVPSQEEVLNDGVKLGEINAILLEKIEELTLYIIEINNKQNELQESYEQLQKQVLLNKKR